MPGYVTQFAKVFGTKDAVTIDNAVKAIAAFERTLITPDSPVDRFLRGDKKALSADAQNGLKLVQDIGCAACHSGVDFAGPALPAGQGFYQKFPTVPGTEYEKKYNLTEDLGRYAVTKNDADKSMWRVPTWRNIALTAPYFHNGSVATLPEAVRVMAKTQLDKDLTDEQVGSIVAFLTGLTGQFPRLTLPRLPETPGLTLLDGRNAPAM
jgi:cytochrome c peroxidase